jgi:hypothetical protein
MASGNITSTTNTFGDVPGTLSGSIGVPGPQGPTGPTGPQGPAGQGVPAGGTAGQFLTKIDGTNYNTDWTTLNLSAYATLASPIFTGDPTAPTAALGDNDTSIATTAFVQQELLSGTANARNLEVEVRNQSGSTMAAGTIVYVSGATGNKPLITKAQANNDANSAQTIGFVKTSIANNGTGYVIVRGVLEAIDTSALTEGAQLYLSPSTAGTWTTTKPSAPQHLVYVGVVIRSHPTLGTILVSVQNGYELHELHDVALSSEANNDLLVYELSTDLWKNKSFATLGLATLASPAFTGTPTAPTAAAATNTTQIATTAFVQQEVPAASTTAAGKVELATDAEVIAGTSTTLALVANNYRIAGLTTNIWAPGVTGLSALSSGTGANTGSTVSSLNGAMVAPNASTAGYATRGFTVGYPSNNVSTGYNFGTASGHSVRVYINTQWASTIAGVKMRGVFGRSSATLAVPATLAARAYGWEWDFSSRTMNIIAHDGTTLTTTAVTWNPANGRTYEITATSNGSGTISLYVDGTLLGTSSGGPTGTVSTALIWWQYEIQNEATAGAQVITQYANPKVYTTNG